jgi:glycosyltransferase involved in cell wall biosynthesis
MDERTVSELNPAPICSARAGLSPLISVVVPAFNAEKTLQGCLEALLSQEFPKQQYEVIVVDNGSTDRTWTIIQSYAPAVRSLQETRVHNSYAARNVGVRASLGKLIAFTDADCVPDPMWLRRLVENFDTPMLGCVAGEILPFNPVTPAEKFAAQTRMLSQSKTQNHPYRPYAVTANVAYRREVFEQIGLFNSSLQSGGDADFCWRMQQQTSWGLCFNDAPIVLHHHRTSWPELWKQFVRYGQGDAALQALYTDYRQPFLGSVFRCLRRLLILAGCATRYLVSSSLRQRSHNMTREAVNFAFYDFIRNAAFTFGKLRGSRASSSKCLKQSRQSVDALQL